MYNNINKNSKKNSNKAWSPKPEKPMRQKSGKEKFFDKMEKTNKGFYVRAVVPKSLPDNMTYTTNGAVAYSTTSSALLDMFTKLVSYRSLDEQQIVTDWRKAFNENPYLAMRFLGYTMDIRCGAGERRFTQIVIRDLVKNGGASIAAKLVPLIGEYSRYDMLYQFRGNPTSEKAVRDFLKKQFAEDMENMKQHKSISLLGKWLDKPNSHSKQTRDNGLWTAKQLNMTERNYRKALSALRKYLDVVERKMSSDNWAAIDYETVPSKANLNYNKAFLRHDTERRQAFLSALKTGEAKINASVANPCDIVNKYMNLNGRWYGLPQRADDTLEGMWKALPDMIPDDKGMLVVCDCSGSMESGIGGNTNMRCIDVAMSLAIYCADHLKGAFANKYITFSADPHIVRFGENDTLCQKLVKTLACQDCSNTNLEKVFDLILKTAIDNHSPQSDLPERILIVSDGEFDSMCDAKNTINRYGWSSSRTRVDKTFMQNINQRFKNAGYEGAPLIVFWRVNCRNNLALPFKQDERGIMVSGYSTNLLKMVLSDKTNPMDALLEQLNIPRYDCFEAAYSA